MPTNRQAGSGIANDLVRVSQAVKRIALAEGERFGLTPAQVQTILFCLNTRTDVASIGHLAQSLATSHATAVGVVDGLVRRGYLRRRRGIQDRRVTIIALTDEGQRIGRQLEPWNSALKDAVERLPLDTQMLLTHGLRELKFDLFRLGHLHLNEPCNGCEHFAPNDQPGAPTPHFCRFFRRRLTTEEALQDCPKHSPIRPTDG